MRTTITIDDELLDKARKYTGVTETPTLIRLALEGLVQREAARRLAQLGGSAPDLVAPPRRRFDPVEPE
ncbi:MULTISPECIES: type II toxin-antitoxin system VapB family antitoxin [unclassified Neorhizobium]|jgi:Arc/MetJ family transcription regulator|uniref:type II toxin-antitoxin system VapB family antitoxin n=1 Tax=unclassified Neorhizobium TaxID=2629175 RepID=UPI001FF5BF6E|nr:MULTISPECIES: type II toxin-antitoxin system VapB family antitoxin [unclassified Neorhizobium]MCJ9672655.1 type II toxin-antitoxin system VapB family antitoxin [Neorhizobium sp. SHOUNA12B]MCJ9748305.1 type II toxin-antitoxin system VapB family antitoxin [Neorhizobium sp. SHOUNA12A]